MNESLFESMTEALKKDVAKEIAYTYSVFVPKSTENITSKMKSNILLSDRRFLDTDLQKEIGNKLIFPYEVLRGNIEKQVYDFYSEINLSSKTLEKLSHYGDIADAFKKRFRDNLEKSKKTTSDILQHELNLQIMQGKDVKSVISHIQNVLSQRALALKSLLIESAGQMERYMLLWDYQDKGLTHYRFRTNGGSCKKCMALNDKVFPITDAEVGINLASLHPNCDCVTEILDKQGNIVFSTQEEADKDETSGALGYLQTSIKQVLLGNYFEDTNMLGTLGQVALGLLGLDLPADVRDLIYDITNFEMSVPHAIQTLLDALALFPVVGGVKYIDEAGGTLKVASKYGDDAAEVIKDSKNLHKTVKRTKPMTAKEALEAAKALGFEATGYFSHGQPVFKKGNKYITPDIDGHIGGVWKMANSIKDLRSKKTRLGTYDETLKRIGD